MKLLIKNGTVIDPANKINKKTDIFIENGVIADIDKIDKNSSDIEVIDAQDKIVAPGLVDMHTHLRDPGYEYKEDIQSASNAASAGGFTSITAMPNSNPVNDNSSITEYIIKKGASCGKTDIFPIASATKGQKGTSLSEIAELKEAGAIAVSDDGRPVENSEIMRRLLEYTRMFNMPVISHCEDLKLAKNGVMNEGIISTKLGLPGIPNAAEDIQVARDISLLRLTKGRLHIAHVSTAESVKLIEQAKKEGLAITCEVSPHHFMLTDEAVLDYDTNTKVNPPLRTKKDIEEIKRGLKEGIIDAIATDHAPHEYSEKMVEYSHAPFGISGLETALSLSLSLYFDKTLSLEEIISKMTINPSRIIGIKRGTLSQGADANVTIIDLNKKVTVNTAKFKSKGKNSPFNGMTLTGCPHMTIYKGKVVFDATKQ